MQTWKENAGLENAVKGAVESEVMLMQRTELHCMLHQDVSNSARF